MAADCIMLWVSSMLLVGPPAVTAALSSLALKRPPLVLGGKFNPGAVTGGIVWPFGVKGIVDCPYDIIFVRFPPFVVTAPEKGVLYA